MNVDEELARQDRQQDLAQDMAHGRELMRRIDLGLAAKQLIDSPLGQRMLQDSERERANLAEEHLTLDVESAEGRARAREIRIRVGILDHWQQLFAAYITDGEHAEAEFHERGEVPPDA